jgi:hypothetical protein
VADYAPLYPPDGAKGESGVPVRAYGCNHCGKVVPTHKGIRLHLQLKHKIVLQLKLPMAEAQK